MIAECVLALDHRNNIYHNIYQSSIWACHFEMFFVDRKFQANLFWPLFCNKTMSYTNLEPNSPEIRNKILVLYMSHLRMLKIGFIWSHD
jgi:hypothetical protein